MKAKKNKILTVKQQKVMVLRVKKTGIAQFRSANICEKINCKRIDIV
jgi:hypothetical protein